MPGMPPTSSGPGRSSRCCDRGWLPTPRREQDGGVLVEIYSDVVCPWCYIGKRRFEKALAGFDRADEVKVVWKPYQLDPTAPPTPTPVREAYARKFGGPDAASQIIDRVTAAAAGEGLEFLLDRALRANTFDAHRLMWWA